MTFVDVYRVELPNEDCTGPYASPLPWSFATPPAFDRHPGPSSDGLGVRDGAGYGMGPENERYGFRSKEQLREWFDDAAESLTTSGFIVSHYTVPDEYVEYGGRQVIFQIDQAELVARTSLTEAGVR